jgi:hypothetical protein
MEPPEGMLFHQHLILALEEPFSELLDTKFALWWLVTVAIGNHIAQFTNEDPMDQTV